MVDLQALVDGVSTSTPAGATPAQRAQALWRLIQGEIELLGLPDERAAVRAALHLDPTNREATIDKRLIFARDRGDFGVNALGKRPGYDALRRWWGEGVRKLGHAVDERLDFLDDHRDKWQEYLGGSEDGNKLRYRKPPLEAQPVFVELLITTVYMQGRSVHRRITERLVIAQEDGVEYYTVKALAEQTDLSSGVPVRALWGCRAEHVMSRRDAPVLTRLWFPTALRQVQRHYFSSEAIPGEVVTNERRAVNVEVDHYGIGPGERIYGLVPVRGLTVRVSFAEGNFPEACWWYADLTAREPEEVRFKRPEADEDRGLTLTPQGYVEHTFAGPCQPLANYGVAFAWPCR